MNKKRQWMIVFWWIFVVSFFLGCSSIPSTEQQETRVLIVHSYHSGFDWTKTIDEGIMEALHKQGLHLQKFYMNSKYYSDPQSLQQIGLRALDLIRIYKPDVVITTDDNAQQYVGRFLVNRPDLAVVFCGVNENPEYYGYPGNNVTGIRELPMLRNSVNLFQRVLPQAKSFTVLTSFGTTSDGFITYLKELKLAIRIERIIEPKTFSEWKNAWLGIQSDAIITYEYHTLQENKKTVSPNEVFSWCIAHMNKPVIGFFKEDIEGGFLLGHVQSGFEQGEMAAKKTIEILNGKKANEIPITVARGGLVMINGTSAYHLHIDITPIKNSADVIFYQ